MISALSRRAGSRQRRWRNQEEFNTVIVDELTKDEIDELGDAAPQLMAAFSNQPSYATCALNLFRLSRLARHPATAT